METSVITLEEFVWYFSTVPLAPYNDVMTSRTFSRPSHQCFSVQAHCKVRQRDHAFTERANDFAERQYETSKNKHPIKRKRKKGMRKGRSRRSESTRGRAPHRKTLETRECYVRLKCKQWTIPCVQTHVGRSATAGLSKRRDAYPLGHQ